MISPYNAIINSLNWSVILLLMWIPCRTVHTINALDVKGKQLRQAEKGKIQATLLNCVGLQAPYKIKGYYEVSSTRFISTGFLSIFSKSKWHCYGCNPPLMGPWTFCQMLLPANGKLTSTITASFWLALLKGLKLPLRNSAVQQFWVRPHGIINLVCILCISPWKRKMMAQSWGMGRVHLFVSQ